MCECLSRQAASALLALANGACMVTRMVSVMEVSEALDTILTTMEANQTEHRKMHLELLKAIEGMGRRRSETGPSTMRKSAPSLGREHHSLGPAPSMQEMQDATRKALTDSCSLFKSFSAKSWPERRSYRSLQSVGEDTTENLPMGLPCAPAPAAVQDGALQNLQGPCSPAAVFPMPGGRRGSNGSNMQTMDRNSQAQILSTGSDLDSGDGWAIRMLTTYPRCVMLCVSVPGLLQLVCMSWLTIVGYANSTILSLNSVSTAVYASLAIASVALLDKAWRSSHFEIAVSRLQLLVEDFKKRWSQVSGREWRRYTAAWLLTVAAFAATQVLQAWVDEHEGISTKGGIHKSWKYIIGALNLVSYGISSAVVILAAFVQTDLLLGLDKSLDCWCCQIVNHNVDFGLGVESWNATQALLKSIARELAPSFLALQILSGLGFVYFLAVGVTFVFRSEHQPVLLLVEGLSSLPLVWLFLLSLHVCSHGAELTEKCQGIPAFVNQILTTHSTDVDRQYLVRFVSDSSAGFIVRDTKLTRELFMKQLFLFVGLLSALVSVLSRLYF